MVKVLQSERHGKGIVVVQQLIPVAAKCAIRKAINSAFVAVKPSFKNCVYSFSINVASESKFSNRIPPVLNFLCNTN